MCVITACGVQCLVAGCRGSGAEQQAVSPGRGMLHVQHPSSCREKVNPTLMTCIIIHSNVRMCYCFLIGEKRHH